MFSKNESQCRPRRPSTAVRLEINGKGLTDCSSLGGAYSLSNGHTLGLLICSRRISFTSPLSEIRHSTHQGCSGLPCNLRRLKQNGGSARARKRRRSKRLTLDEVGRPAESCDIVGRNTGGEGFCLGELLGEAALDTSLRRTRSEQAPDEVAMGGRTGALAGTCAAASEAMARRVTVVVERMFRIREWG